MPQPTMIEQLRSTGWSRREFLIVATTLSFVKSASLNASRQMLTAGLVIERIKANIGIPWRAQTVDNLIAGTALTPVRGIATTMMATLDVLERANAAGKNMIITHESTFFSHQDSTQAFANDSTYAFKRDFLNRNQMAVFHFHDHWHARRPDGIAIGMMQELGWQNRVDPQNVRRFSFDGVPLAAFARDIQARLNIRVVRVVGDPTMPVRKVVASGGNVSLNPGAPLLAQEDVDVLIIGETHEWELVEYAQDMIASGKKKALIILGHVVSEQAGMKYCAEWLRGFIPEAPIEFIAAAEPYWSPTI